jgi:hypothetical protein
VEYLFAPFAIFQLVPAFALVPAAVLGWLQYRAAKQQPGSKPQYLGFITSLLWLAYAVWEWRVKIWAETVTAPIRVDLLLIYPLLIILTSWSLFAIWRRFR